MSENIVTQAEVNFYKQKSCVVEAVYNQINLLAESKTIANKKFKNKCQDLLSKFQNSNMSFYQRTTLVGYMIGNTLVCVGEIPKEKIDVQAIIELLDDLLRALKIEQTETKNDKDISDLLFNEINDCILQTYMNICICILSINSDEIEQKNDLLKLLFDLLGNNKFTDMLIKSKCKEIVNSYLTALLDFTFANKFFYLSDIQKNNFGNTLKYLFQCNQINNFQMVLFLNILSNLATFISYNPEKMEPQEYSSIRLGQDVETFIINTLSEIISNESLNQQIFNPNNKLAVEYYITTLVNLTYRIPKFKCRKDINNLLNCVSELFVNQNFITALDNPNLCYLFFRTIFNFISNWKSLDQNQQRIIIEFMMMLIENDVLNKNLLTDKINFEVYFNALKAMCENTKRFDIASSFLLTDLIFTIFANGYLKQFSTNKNDLPAQINDVTSDNIAINSLSDTPANYLDNKKINICLEILCKATLTDFSNKDNLSVKNLNKFLCTMLKIFDVISDMDIFNTEIKNADKDKTIYPYINLLCNISELAKSKYIKDKCRWRILFLVENILSVQKFNPIKAAIFCKENNYKQRINFYITQIFSNLLYFQTIKETNRSIEDQLIKLFLLILKNEQLCKCILFPQDNIDEYYKNYDLGDINLWKNMLKKIKDKSEKEVAVVVKTIDRLNNILKLYEKKLTQEIKPLLLVHSNLPQKHKESIFGRLLDKRGSINLIPIQQPITSKSKFK